MRYRFVRLAFLPAFAFAACAGSLATVSPSSEMAATIAEGVTGSDELVCTTEKPIGSNISKRVCRSPERIDQEQREAQEFVERLNAPRPASR